MRAIDTALARTQLTTGEAKAARFTWAASAKALARAGTAQRRSEIRAVRTYATNLAARGQLAGARIPAVLLSVKATVYAAPSQARDSRRTRRS